MSYKTNILFPSNDIRLKRVYRNTDFFSSGKQYTIGSKIKDVYGDIFFPGLPDGRTYTLGSFVQSIDGKIAFPESPDGTLVAKGNRFDSNGALADFWILNMLRSICDAVLMGGKTLEREPDLTGHIHDPLLIDMRIKNGKPEIPLHVVISGSGRSIHKTYAVIKDPDIPLIVITSDEGEKLIRKKLEKTMTFINNPEDVDINRKTKAVVSIGNNGHIPPEKILKFLKRIGIHMMLVESPVFLMHLMKESLLDELFLNTSGIFIGGDAPALGSNTNSFNFRTHPYGRVISIHSHSDFFFYTRYRMEYSRNQSPRTAARAE